jgi:hypothetical protein
MWGDLFHLLSLGSSTVVKKAMPAVSNVPALFRRIVKLIGTIFDSLDAEGEKGKAWGDEADHILLKIRGMLNLMMEVRDKPLGEKTDTEKLEKVEKECDWFIAKLISRGFKIEKSWTRRIGRCEDIRVLA